MNNAPSNQTGVNNTFSQGSQQTNPFTADLKGEFTSNFGTNTNAVSQIFKEGGFVSSNKTKYLLIAGAIFVVMAVMFYIYSSEDALDSDMGEEVASTDPAAEEGSETGVATDPAAAPAVDPATGKTATDSATGTDMAATDSATATSSASGEAPTLSSPGEGWSSSYDETSAPVDFNWTGAPGGFIVFSRSKSMSPETMRIAVTGNSYSFNHPWPGAWFWRVENSTGTSEVHKFTISAPSRRNVVVTAPQASTAVAGTGGVVTWQGDERVAFYRVEFSNGGWANPTHRFATSGSQVQLQGVAPGQYQMRVGAFSEVAGRWEYTAPMSVTVQ